MVKSLLSKLPGPSQLGGAIALFRTLPRVRVRATVKLSAAFFHDESSVTMGGYESAIAPPVVSSYKAGTIYSEAVT